METSTLKIRKTKAYKLLLPPPSGEGAEYWMCFEEMCVAGELKQMGVSIAGICAALAIIESFISNSTRDQVRTSQTQIGNVRVMKIDDIWYRVWFFADKEGWMTSSSLLLTLEYARSLKQIVTSDDFPAAEKEGDPAISVTVDVCD